MILKRYGELIMAAILNVVAFALLIIMMILFALTVTVYAATVFEWDRNAETDVDHYELYACTTSPTCTPTVSATERIGTNIPQPAIGVKPTMPIPVGNEGRAAVIAVDQTGNQSGLSNIVPFDRKSPASPGGLVTK